MGMADFQRGPARLRWLLVAIVALAALPVFALYLSRLNASSERALDEAREFASSLAKSGAAQQLGLVRNARGFAEALKHIPAIQRPTAACDALFAEVNSKAGWAASLFLLNDQGIGICSSRPSARGMNFSDRPYFKDVLKTGDFVVSEAIIGRVTKQPVVAAGLPIKNAAA
ncbi:MAG: hypothetical protein AB7O46_05020, partial [Xanthobacteraceae bacterium]